ncbi:MAG: quinolinate synthase NadA [Alphaproteobacteria bacterium]|nr:quinolinate synthase NadA [Alphaproteobacteria bacterium]
MFDTVAKTAETQQMTAALGLSYSPAVAREAAPLYERVKRVVNELDWATFAPYVLEINRLKKEKGAVVLAHNYMTPEIFHCVSDFSGDSLQLAQQAAATDAQLIVQAGVHFMAETSKILSPEKTVLIPDLKAGCSLASSITGADVRLLRQKYPGVPIVTYVNTSADVKAESDICCTSSNALKIVESLESDTVLMIPDKYLARNIAKQTKKKILTWEGACEVHERFTPEDIRKFRKAYPGAVVLGHPECPPEVIAECDFSGSTKAMSDYVTDRQPRKVVMITECSMSDNVSVKNPNVEFVRPCNLCPHMKRISLPKILNSLLTHTHEVEVDLAVAARAKAAVEKMLEASK